jgi:DNA-binding response OmpR family regulator
MSSQFCAGASGACDKTGAHAAAPAFGADRLIAKPFRRHDLLGAVRALVGPANPVDCATHARQRA